VHDLPLRADGRMVVLESRPWRLDPIPLVMDGDEFVALADGAIARMQMLEAILDDVYGARTLLRDAAIDPSRPVGEPAVPSGGVRSTANRRWLTNYAVDIVRDVDGQWRVVRDLTDAPAGVGYALLGRSVASRVHRDVISRLPAGHALRSLDPFADRLRDGLADVALSRDPRIVVLSGGVDHPSFVEQSYLATRLGLNLVEGADLVVRQRRVWLAVAVGAGAVDVVFRRLEDDRVDPMEVNAEGNAGVPGLLLAARSNGVSLANAHGSGVIEDPALAEQWDSAGAWLTGRTADYQGVWPLPFMSAAERRDRSVERVAELRRCELVDRAITLRLHLVASDKGIDVLQGGSARVLLAGDDPIKPTAATAKDVWVIGGTVAPPLLRRRKPLPQVDLIASVPTRAAEALFWAGRAMERAEILARAMEVVLDRTSGLVAAEVAEPWANTVSTCSPRSRAPGPMRAMPLARVRSSRPASRRWPTNSVRSSPKRRRYATSSRRRPVACSRTSRSRGRSCAGWSPRTALRIRRSSTSPASTAVRSSRSWSTSPRSSASGTRASCTARLAFR
jgi:uncharacterized circularly permuted ATP-grasp superfamily protein